MYVVYKTQTNLLLFITFLIIFFSEDLRSKHKKIQKSGKAIEASGMQTRVLWCFGLSQNIW
jgi:hypothetical protein